MSTNQLLYADIILTIASDAGLEMLDNIDKLPEDAGEVVALHGETFVRSHRPILRRQVANMSITGEDGVVVAQVFIDGLCLGRRLYDDERFTHEFRLLNND